VPTARRKTGTCSEFSAPRVVRVEAARARKTVTTKVSPKVEVKDQRESSSARDKALESVMSSLDGQFGKGTIMKMGAAGTMKIDTFSSGSLTLDMALGGGIPRGRIMEIYGPESAGKTTLGLHAMAEMQKSGGVAAMIDAEHAFDAEYAAKLGVNVDKLLVCQPESGEMALEVVDQLVRSSAVDVILVDSVAALVPRAEIEGEIGMIQVGSQARLMSQALRKLVQNAAKCKCTVIFINQIRYKIGVIYGSPETTPGGNALKFYCSVRVDIRRAGFIKGADGLDAGIRVRTKVVKNKVARPYRVAEMDIMFHKGISSVGCVLDCAEELGIIARKGAWYSYGGSNLGQGRDKTVAYLEEHQDVCSEIEALVRAGQADGMPEDDTLDILTGEEDSLLSNYPPQGSQDMDLMYSLLDDDETEAESVAKS